MNVDLINTGSELMLGRVLNTHQRWLGRRLADEGLVVTRQVSVADTAPAILEVLTEALRRSSLIITTGGLGPTSDDLTRDMVAGLLERRLVEDPEARANVESFFHARRRSTPPRVLVQALVPEGAIVLPNRNGTAPGLAIEVPAGTLSSSGAWLIMLPGPPRELVPMVEESVIPLLRERFPRPGIHCVTLRTSGIGESRVEELLQPRLPPLMARGLEVGYCARPGEVDVRLVARGEDDGLITDAERTVRDVLDEAIYSMGDDLMEEVVMGLLKQQGARFAVAESCTGGLLAHRLTNLPGASEVFWGGWVTYANEAKIAELGVDPAILSEHGAVSEACAAAMATGALARSVATHALALTGIAGPGGGSIEKPVGTVFIGLASANAPVSVQRFLNPYDRETFKQVATQQALEMLRRRLRSGIAQDPPQSVAGK